MAKLNKARQKLIDMYIESLNEEKIPWEKGWVIHPPKNGITNHKYYGVNNLILSYIAAEREYKDSRWCTYNQLKKKGYKLKEGSKGMGVMIEYWGMNNQEQKKTYNFPDYYKYIAKHPDENENFKIVHNCFYVFNGDRIDGLPKEKQQFKKEKIESSNYINNLISKMKVKYDEFGNTAYYSPKEDKVVVPKAESFKENYYYFATQLHELCHATGHSTRLNRDIMTKFGTPEYAKEELRAEISSSFLMQSFDLPGVDKKHYDNHKSYIQSWISILKNEPQELFNAVTDSNKITKYLEDIVSKNQSKNIIEEDINISEFESIEEPEIDIS